MPHALKPVLKVLLAQLPWVLSTSLSCDFFPLNGGRVGPSSLQSSVGHAAAQDQSLPAPPSHQAPTSWQLEDRFYLGALGPKLTWVES